MKLPSRSTLKSYDFGIILKTMIFLARIIEFRVRLNSNQTRTRMINGNRTRGSTNHSRTRLIPITNHVMVYTHKNFDDPGMVQESCKTKLIWFKLKELHKIFESSARFAQKLQKS